MAALLARTARERRLFDVCRVRWSCEIMDLVDASGSGQYHTAMAEGQFGQAVRGWPELNPRKLCATLVCRMDWRRYMAKTHRYAVTVKWTGNAGTGTSGYKNYERRHEILGEGAKPAIPCSSDPSFAEMRRVGIPRNCCWRRCLPATSFGISICARRRELWWLITLTTPRDLWRRHRMGRGDLYERSCGRRSHWRLAAIWRRRASCMQKRMRNVLSRTR